MSTIRFGSTCSPSKTTLAEPLPRWNDEEGEKADPEDACDPNKLLQCPYDKNHQIRACRFPYHLIKCSKNHPKLASELKTCPFNARHLMPKHELSHHIANCVDRISVNAEDLGSAEVQSKWQVPVSTWTNTNCDEDWDKEADISSVPFVWGVSTNLISQNRTEPCTTNNLTPGLRAPRTLPWKMCKSCLICFMLQHSVFLMVWSHAVFSCCTVSLKSLWPGVHLSLIGSLYFS
ncbi:gametocyte-specific factor 1 isoform X1 [Salvelinus namaycush]|uniref:Gametocyte-specific factor 1 isoform X1 n=2 Tax=Salvelinus namaycush TaxID=8040 RepID=A0A8U1BV19_SALNM|nr:gametocyte-specific factor 1 isoform X1 [Salvelinus namaycush]